LEPFTRSKLHQPVACNAKITILYQRSWSSTTPADQVLIRKVRHGLTSISSAISERTIEVNFGPVSEELNLDCDLVFAIVDNTIQNQDHTRAAVARLHKHFDRKAGVLLVCATYSHLDKLFKGALVPSDKYFPASLRAKINLKLGGINRTTGLMRLVAERRLMIAGGHISHYSTRDRYRPSIYAVVASNDVECQNYLGSVRIHSTAQNIDSRPTIRTSLYEIYDMMIERFKHCDELNPPTEILFFRDGKNFGDNAKDIKCECDAIRKAHQDLFTTSAPLHITYVVVNKNMEIKVVEKDHTGGGAIPTFDYVVEHPSIAKYRYYVMANELNYSQDALTDLVSCSSQQTPILGV
jgi:hypothetical protein